VVDVFARGGHRPVYARWPSSSSSVVVGTRSPKKKLLVSWKIRKQKQEQKHTKTVPGARDDSRAPFVVIVCSGGGGGGVWTRRGGGSCVLTRQGGGSGGRVEMDSDGGEIVLSSFQTPNHMTQYNFDTIR
jgi:hypothetical protein